MLQQGPQPPRVSRPIASQGGSPMATTAVTAPNAAPPTPFNLGPDQVAIRDWVRDFAVRVVRPAAEEWDEREETPWPILQEAAKIGLYGFDFLATTYADETGLLMPAVNEELFWGDAGIDLSTKGLSMGAKHRKLGIRASHTAEVVLEDVRVPMANLLGGLERLERRMARARERQNGGSNGNPNSAEEERRSSSALRTLELS